MSDLLKTQDTIERHLSPQELADRVGVPVQTVYVWRTKGYGPRGMTIGRHVRFSLAEVLKWEEAQLDKRP